MLEELKEESIVRKVGGRFRLSSLIQKRLVMMGASGVSIQNTSDRMRAVIQEIQDDRIWLDTEGNLRVRDDADGAVGNAVMPGADPFDDLA